MNASKNEWDLSGVNLHSVPLSDEELKYFCTAIENIAGISIRTSKRDLVRTRLRHRLVEMGLKSYEEYRRHLEKLAPDDKEWQEFINLLTTNKTDFFREPKHFDFMVSEVIPEWLKTGEKTFKVWCAASSTGEEPYTLAMVLKRHLPADRDFKILATDIDTEVLERAQNGVYPMSKFHEIPESYQKACLDLGKNAVKDWFRIKPELRDRVTFKQHNLIEPTAPGEGVFDLVSCRNVLIYMNKEAIDFITQKMYGVTKLQGYYFIGHSETLQGIKHRWKPIAASTFKKVK